MQIQEQCKFVNENGIYIPNKEWECSRKLKDQWGREKLWCHCTSSSKNKGYLKRIYMREGNKERKVWDDKCNCLWP